MNWRSVGIVVLTLVFVGTNSIAHIHAQTCASLTIVDFWHYMIIPVLGAAFVVMLLMKSRGKFADACYDTCPMRTMDRYKAPGMRTGAGLSTIYGVGFDLLKDRFASLSQNDVFATTLQ